MQYKAVCFDIDGTMGDTFPICIPLLRDTFSFYSGRKLKDNDVTCYFGINEDGIAMKLAGDKWQQASERYHQDYARALQEHNVQPFPGIRELIKALQEKGVLLLLITGKCERSCHITLDFWGLDSVFAAVNCGDTYKNNKDEHLRTMLQKYCLKAAEVCYIGDALSDFTACKATGVTCYSALWQPQALDRQELLELNSANCFDSVDKLAAFLLPKCVKY